MKLVTILSNLNGHLIVVQQPQRENYIIWIVLLGVVVIVFGFQRMWQVALLIPAFFVVLLFLLSFLGQKTSFRAEVDPQAHQIISEELSRDKIISKTIISTDDISSAEMQSNRGATRIVLLLHNGTQVFPLGQQHLQNEPDQYVVLTAMRQAIGQ